MAKLSELGKVMHEEHFRTLVLICGIENRIGGDAANRPIDPTDSEDRVLLEDLVEGLQEIIGHNAFEESVLFPLLDSDGAGDLALLLTQEHFVMGPQAKRLRALASEILACGASEERWATFRAVAAEFASQLMGHLQKEEMTIVQRLSTLLDREVDHALALRRTAERDRSKPAKRAGEAA
ncbi:MAG: hemerythrin domain-containing protein [Rhodospirillales bacterium]